MSEPELTDQSRKVLRIIMDTGLIKGFDLQRRAELENGDQLITSVQPLIINRLVTASGVLDPSEIRWTQFAILPSAWDRISELVRKVQ